jgi:hypothetical protein
MEDLSRILRVADQMSTGYACLRDQYALRARILDFSILAIASWLLAMTFVSSDIARRLAPFGIAQDLWIGFLAVGTFVLALMQSRVDWKSRSDAYQRALQNMAEIVLDIRRALATQEGVDPQEAASIAQKYYIVLRFIEPIPENRFLELKRRHRLKIEISKLLDEYPSLHIGLVRAKLWYRDNVRKKANQ